MSLSAVKTEVESQLSAISSTDTWQDILVLFELEIDNILISGDNSSLQSALENYYPSGTWTGLGPIIIEESNETNTFTVEDVSIPGSGNLTLSSAIQFPSLAFWKLTGVNANEISGASGFDPDNISTGEANLTNGNFTDLCYNNSANGNLPGRIFALDLGTPQDIGSLKIYDWGSTSGGTYMITSGNIVTSNDGSTWTTQTSFSDKNYTGLTGESPFQAVLPSVVNARYVGAEYIAGNSASFWVLSELEAFGPPTGGDLYEPVSLNNSLFSIEQTTDTFDIILKNKTSGILNLKMRSNRQ